MATRSIEELETKAREIMRVQLAEPISVANQALNLISDLVQMEIPGTIPKALIVRSLLLERIQNDFRCALILAELGYPLQAVSLITSVFEGWINLGAFVDDSDAQSWLDHDEEYKAFGSVKGLLEQAVTRVAGDKSDLDLLYGQYGQLCMAKHLNPIVERVRGYRGDGKSLTFLLGPDTSDQAIQQAWFALERGSRFILLAVATFIHDLERPGCPHRFD